MTCADCTVAIRIRDAGGRHVVDPNPSGPDPVVPVGRLRAGRGHLDKSGLPLLDPGHLWPRNPRLTGPLCHRAVRRRECFQMVSVSAGPAVTGLYPVVEVAGQPPTLLTDFVGAAAVTLQIDGQPIQLTGMGGLTANGMEFEQRDPPDLDHTGVRIWTIIEDRDQTFWAEPLNRGPA